MTIDPEVRQQIHDLYAAYSACLDDGRYQDWPDFFADDAWYRVVPRENFDRNLPLSTISLKGRAMMKDRVYGIEGTIFHAPYYQRHLVSIPLISSGAEGCFDVKANYTVIRTKRDQMSEIFNVGRYDDVVKIENNNPKFIKKFCIFDNDIIPNSLIYPI
jgi:salicylate 5-hydroxylase small subunit